MDIRLYSSGEIKRSPNSFGVERLNRGLASDDPAKDLEVIANMVTKFLLTYIGTDALEKDYGGVAMHYTNISKAFIPKLTFEMLEDLARCKQYFSNMRLTGSGEGIKDISLLKIVYNEDTIPDKIEVHIEIITTKERRALLALLNKG